MPLVLQAERATVKSESAVLRSAMEESGPALMTLGNGDAVDVRMALDGPGGAWCSVETQGPQRRSGYVRCDQLDRTAGGVSLQGSPDQEAVIDTLLELSGTKRQIGVITDPRQFQALLRNDTSADAELVRLRRALTLAFRPEAFHGPLRRYISRNFSQARAPFLLQWLYSPLSRKMVEIELQAARPEAVEELKRYRGEFAKKSPPVSRLLLVQRLDEALQSSQFHVDMQMLLFRNAMEAINPSLPARLRLPDVELKRQIDSLRADLWPQARDTTWIHLLYIYRSVPDSELEEYVRFWESPNGRWFPPLLHGGLLDAVSAVTQELSRQLAGR